MRMILLLFVLALALPAPAQLQVTPAKTYGAPEKKKKEHFFGGFLSATRQMPPLPYNPFPDLPVSDAGNTRLSMMIAGWTTRHWPRWRRRNRPRPRLLQE